MMLFELLLFIFTLGVPSSSGWQPIVPTPPPATCPVKGSLPVLNKCVLVEEVQNTWEEANWYCNNLGLKLIEITSGSFYFDLIMELRKRGLTYYSYWAGAQRNSYRNPEWCWTSSCDPIHESFWSPLNVAKRLKEPASDFNKRCALLDAHKNHFLAAARCEERNRFICEGPSSLPHQKVTPKGLANPESSPKLFTFGVAIFLGDNSTTPKPTVPRSAKSHHRCPTGWAFWDKKESCYSTYETPLSFQEAFKACEKKVEGAHLVDIVSEEENTFIAGLIPTNSSSNLWIGLRNKVSGFYWITGEPYDYSNWSFGEPGKHVCATIASSGFWIGENCVKEKGYICETPATPIDIYKKKI